MFGKNKKTSLAGLGMVLTAIADIMQGIGAGDMSMVNWQVDITSIIGGIGLLLAKDGNVTGGTISQPSSTQALVDKAVEKRTPEASAALRGDKSAVSSDAIAPAP